MTAIDFAPAGDFLGVCDHECSHEACALERALADDLDVALSDIDEHETIDVDQDPAAIERVIRAVARRRRKLAEAQAVVDRQLAVIDEHLDRIRQPEVERLQAWLAEESKKFDTSWLESVLAHHHRQVLAANPKAKTLTFPSGRLVARKQPDEWTVDDPAAVVQWALRECVDRLVRTKHELDRAALKKACAVKDDGTVALKDTGEFVPGVTVDGGEVRFQIVTENLG